jgi:hypothetical protein
MFNYADFLEELSSNVLDPETRLDALSREAITVVFSAITSFIFAVKIVGVSGFAELSLKLWRGVLLAMYAVLEKL